MNDLERLQQQRKIDRLMEIGRNEEAEQLQRRIDNIPTDVEVKLQQRTPVNPVEDHPLMPREPKPLAETYTPSTLSEDPEAMDVIREYMESFHGLPKDTDPEEMVSMFLKRQRNFASANSITTLDEFYQLQKADEDKLSKAYHAYDLFERLSGTFSEDYTWKETWGSLWNYAGAAIKDPTNLIGFGVGRLATSGGLKLGSKVVTQGVVKSAVKGKVVKEILAGTAADALMTAGLDAVYQKGLIKTGNIEEYSMFQTGLTAVGVLGSGFLLGSAGLTNKAISKRVAQELSNLPTVEEISKAVAKSSVKGIDKNNPNVSNLVQYWDGLGDIKGKTIGKPTLKREDFYKQLLTGIPDAEAQKEGISGGLGVALRDSGVQPFMRFQDDNLSTWLGDAVSALPEEVTEDFINAFNKNMSKKNKIAMMTSEELGQQVKNFYSNVGGIMKVPGDLAKMLDAFFPNYSKTASIDDILKDLIPNEGDIPAGKEPMTVGYIQNSFIKALVAHPATAAVNIIGSGVRGMFDGTANIVQSALYTGAGMRGFYTKDWSLLKKGALMFKASTADRLRYLVTPDATQTEVMKLLEIRPEAKQHLFRWLSGGIDASQNAAKAFNMKEGTLGKTVGDALNNYAEFAQKVYLTEAQDRFFKTQNFMYNLNFRLAKEYGMGVQEFFNMPHEELAAKMGTREFLGQELLAVDDTLRSTFSKPFSSSEGRDINHPVKFVARTIEQIRKVPFIGLAAPFGQFFNNTMDFMADYSGVKLLYRVGLNAKTISSKKSVDDLTQSATRAAVGLSAIWALSFHEERGIEQGLGMLEERGGPLGLLGSDGSIVNRAYDYPWSWFKATARVVAHMRRDGEVPPDVVEEYLTTFGPEAFTRQIDNVFGEFITGFGQNISEGNLESVLKTFVEGMGAMGAQAVSGFTRPLDPLNQAFGAATGDGITVIDRNTGNKTVNNMLRYVDQFFMPALESLGAQEKNTLFNPDGPIPTQGAITGIRTIGGKSSFERMLSQAGMAAWKDGIRTDLPEIDNNVADFVAMFAEEEAAKTLMSPAWDMKGPKAAEARRVAARAAIKTAKDRAIRYMKRNSATDLVTATVFEIYQAGYKYSDIQSKVEELFEGKYKDATELDIVQLGELKRALRQDERIIQQLAD